MSSANYYSRSLSGERLRECYEIAPARVRQYLKAEIDFTLARIEARSRVLELGCGYGRVLDHLRRRAGWVLGIDTSRENLRLAHELLAGDRSCQLAQMNATALGVQNQFFDVVVCVQNGLAAFNVDPSALVAEAVRVTRSGGTILLSTYAPSFWSYRLEWFRMQAERGLVGEIDPDATGDGVIVCKDGFRAGTVSPAEFRRLTGHIAAEVSIEEVDRSSVFCEIRLAESAREELSR